MNMDVFLATGFNEERRVYSSIKALIENSPQDFYGKGDVKFDGIYSIKNGKRDDLSGEGELVYYFKKQSKEYGDKDKAYYSFAVYIMPITVDGERFELSTEDVEYIKGLQQ